MIDIRYKEIDGVIGIKKRERFRRSQRSKFEFFELFSSWNIINHPVVHEGEGKRGTGGMKYLGRSNLPDGVSKVTCPSAAGD